MGLLDNSTDYDELNRKLNVAMARALEDKPEDKNAPLTAGLLSAGLGMLMNSRRGNFAEALGTGGMMGLDAANQTRQRQQKDPVAQMALLNSIMQLQGNVQNQQAMRAFQNDMGGMTQRRMAPQSDYAPGEAPGPTTPPMQVPQQPMPANRPSTPLPYETLTRYANSPNAQVREIAMGQLKQFYPQFELSQGQQRYAPGPDGKPMSIANNVDPTKQQQLPNGQWGFLPGVADSNTAQAGAIAGAQERAKAAIDVVQIPDGKGGTISMPRTQAVALLSQQPQAAADAPPRDVLTAMQALQAKGEPVRWDATTGLMIGDAARNYQAAQIGRALSPDVQAARTTAATAPIEVGKKYTEELNTQNLGLRKDILEEGKMARLQNQHYDRFMQLNDAPGVTSGQLAGMLSRGKNVFDSLGVDVTGLGPEQGMQSIAAQMAMNVRSPASGGGLPGAVSKQDLEFLTSVPPGLAQSKEGRAIIVQTNKAVNNRKIEVQDMLLQHEMEGGKFDAAFMKKVNDYAEQNPLFSESFRQKAGKLSGADEPVVSPKLNQTQRYDVQNILRSGNPALIEQLRKKGLVQ